MAQKNTSNKQVQTAAKDSLRVDGDSKLPTRIAEMLTLCDQWKERRSIAMDAPTTPPIDSDSDDDSNDDGVVGVDIVAESMEV